MSHFVGLCFGDYWESNLEQYYEGLEVEAYVAYTKDEAIDKVKKNVFYISKIGKNFKKALYKSENM